MRYEKPIVKDLSAQARATGDWPLGCYNGSSNSTVCATGSGVTSGRDGCRAGSGATFGVCAAGINPGGSNPQCAAGTGGNADTCSAGSFAT
jgi:hypothetical protein